MNERLIKMEAFEPLINPQKMPNIDLYMDQVIQLFEQNYEPFLRSKEEKVLTKTMVNNYSKEKLYEPIKKKKYEMNHLMLLSMIYQLKNTLSIADIKKISQTLTISSNDNKEFLPSYYQSLYNMDDFLFELIKQNVISIEEEVEKKNEMIGQEKNIFYINLFSQMSAYYKQLAEQLVDEVEEVKDPKFKK